MEVNPMSKSEPQFLAELQQRAMQAQEKFMQNIATRLRRPLVTSPPQHPFQGPPEYWDHYTLEQEQCIALFMENWGKVGGHALRFGAMEEAKAFIVSQAREMKAKYIIRQNQQELAQLDLEGALPEMEIATWDGSDPEEMKRLAAGADIGILISDHAAAYTGSIVVNSAGAQGRTVSLLPTAMFAIIPAERLATRLGEILPQFDDASPSSVPAGIHVISGPSRSADIENDLTIGVHGPGIVYALIVG
jgi:L-lactate dehydrogenase complex protein LldG